MDITKALELRISELQEEETLARHIKDLYGSILAYGAIIQMQKFLKEIEDKG